MGRLTATTTLLLSLLVSAASQAMDSAPGFKLEGMEAPVSLEQQKGKVVYLDFWASWCAPCRQSFPWMNELKQRFGAQGLTIIAVNLDKQRDDSTAFLAATQPEFTIAFDPKGETAELYQVEGMPNSYLIDRNGKLHHRHIGFRTKDKALLESQIEELLKQ